jgi:hypothetical protein
MVLGRDSTLESLTPSVNATLKPQLHFNIGSLAIVVVVVIVSKWAYTLDFG